MKEARVRALVGSLRGMARPTWGSHRLLACFLSGIHGPSKQFADAAEADALVGDETVRMIAPFVQAAAGIDIPSGLNANPPRRRRGHCSLCRLRARRGRPGSRRYPGSASHLRDGDCARPEHFVHGRPSVVDPIV